MKDLVSINRSFLMLARLHAKDPAAALATGLPQEILKTLEDMSIEQIDALASKLPLSVFTMRLNPGQLQLAVNDERGTASRFMVASLASRPEGVRA